MKGRRSGRNTGKTIKGSPLPVPFQTIAETIKGHAPVNLYAFISPSMEGDNLAKDYKLFSDKRPAARGVAVLGGQGFQQRDKPEKWMYDHPI